MDMVYGSFGVGEAVPFSMTKGGVQYLSKETSQALLASFNNKYPQLTSSWSASTGAASPSFDPNADLWSYAAVPGPASPGDQTVAEQIVSLAPGAIVLADVASVKNALSGAPASVVYAIAKNATVAEMLAKDGASLAVVDTSMAQPPAVVPSESDKKKFSIVTPILGAGIGLLVGGPVGAAIGAGIGLGVEAVRTA